MKRTAETMAFSIIFILTISVCTLAWPIPDTGQTKCYNGYNLIATCQDGYDKYGSYIGGQDAYYTINPPSHTKLDAQGNDLPDDAAEWVMVRDNVTKLIWEVKQAKDENPDFSNPRDADNRYTWYDSNSETNGGNAGTPGDETDTEDFIGALNSDSFGGFSDWRLPTREELRSIVDYGNYRPAINTEYFSATQWDYYWSSNPIVNNEGYAWPVKFSHYPSDYLSSSSPYYVRAVRAEQTEAFNSLVVNGDGTVTDTSTGLMWQQKGSDSEMDWHEARPYCESLSLSGYEDWRLPTIKELMSIVALDRYSPAIDTSFFSDGMLRYWSSSTRVYDDAHAWNVDFNNGYDRYGSKSSAFYVRVVRGGQNQLSGHLIISEPTQASVWEAETLMPVKWETQDISGNISISLSRDGGKTYEVISTSTENDGAYDWTVTGPGSVNCVLKIEPLSDPSKETSQGMFTIKAISMAQKKAIIVAGSRSYPDDGLWDFTEKCTNYAYKSLLAQGYTRENILYLSPNQETDVDNDGHLNDVDGYATKAELSHALTVWAKDADELLLYMTDHGGRGTFDLNENETLRAEGTEADPGLDNWLDELQETMPGRVIFIYDACMSGSFIAPLTPPPPGRERIIITSSPPDKPAYFINGGVLSFSYQFWASVFYDGSLYRSFDVARGMMRNDQDAYLDANGDGIGFIREGDSGDVPKEDKLLIKDILIGRGHVTALSPPEIKAVSADEPSPEGATSAMIRAEGVTYHNIISPDKISKVWAVILRPDRQLSPEQPVTDLPTAELTDPDGDGNYEGSYLKVSPNFNLNP